MVERETQLDRERPLIASVIYNRLQAGRAARHRRDDPLRRETTGRGRCASPSSSRRRPVQHAPAHAACRRRRSATPGSPRSRRRRNPAEHRLPLLRRQAGRVPRVLQHRARSSSATSPLHEARGRTGARRRRRRADDVPRRRGLAGRALALAGHAQRRARGGRAAATGATCELPLPPARFAETVRALPAAGFRGINVTIPHKEAALALADEATRRRGRGRRREHAHLRARRGACTPTTRTCPACSRRCRVDPAGATALVLGAGGAARAAVYALRSAGAADVQVWNRTPRARGAAGRRARRARRSTHRNPPTLIVNCTTVGLSGERRIRSRACPSRPIRWASEAAWWTWSTGPAAPRSSPKQGGGGRTWSTDWRSWSPRALRRSNAGPARTAPREVMRAAVAEIAHDP